MKLNHYINSLILVSSLAMVFAVGMVVVSSCKDTYKYVDKLNGSDSAVESDEDEW